MTTNLTGFFTYKNGYSDDLINIFKLRTIATKLNPTQFISNIGFWGSTSGGTDLINIFEQRTTPGNVPLTGFVSENNDNQDLSLLFEPIIPPLPS